MTAPTLRAQVLALRRTQSARAVAQALNIPLGTVKAISSRAGLTRDNAKLREFFRLPEPTASTCTDLQPPVAPPEPVAVTGDNDMDAMLWLRHAVRRLSPQPGQSSPTDSAALARGPVTARWPARATGWNSPTDRAGPMFPWPTPRVAMPMCARSA